MASSVSEAIERAREGEAQAFALIYDRYSKQIQSYAYRLIGDVAQADDVVQDTFLRAWKRLGQLRDDTRLEPWLYAIASNLCTDIVRRRRLLSWLPLLPKHEHVPDAKPEIAYTLGETELVRRALLQLSPKYSVPLVLRHVEGFSCKEIASMLELSIENVWQRLSRGREMFISSYDNTKVDSI